MSEELLAGDQPASEDKPRTGVATVDVDSDYELARFFRVVAHYLFGVPWEDELQLMQAMPLPDVAQATVDGYPLLQECYDTTLPGAPEGIKWATYDVASLIGRNVQCAPIGCAQINAQWGWLYPKGAPAVKGWKLTVTVTLLPSTTYAEILRARTLLKAVSTVDPERFELTDNTCVLYDPALDPKRP